MAFPTLQWEGAGSKFIKILKYVAALEEGGRKS